MCISIRNIQVRAICQVIFCSVTLSEPVTENLVHLKLFLTDSHSDALLGNKQIDKKQFPFVMSLVSMITWVQECSWLKKK